jgi:uncharacterized delta-60 repeat protein
MKKLRLISVLFLFLIQALNAQWVSNYGGASVGDNPLSNAKGLSITVDGYGCCYVAGYCYSTESNNDVLLIKYNENGDTAWTKVFDGGMYADDKAFGVVVDEDGGVYIVGTITVVDKYYQIFVRKYNSDGVLQWDNITGETDGYKEDKGLDIAVSHDGYIFVTGYTTGENGFSNIFVEKIDPIGTVPWYRILKSPEQLDSKAYGIVVDELDNVIITGYTNTAANSNDIIVAKYSSDGDSLWVNTYDGDGHGEDQANDIAVDSYGNAYITGYITSMYSGNDCAILKYESNGTFGWVKTQNGYAYGEDRAYGIVVDELDNSVIITGYVTNYSLDYVTVSYDMLSGDKKWGKIYNGPVGGIDKSNAVGLMSDGRIVVSGQSKGYYGDFDFVTIKYSKLGTPLSMSRYSMSGNSNDVAKDVAVGDDNTVYVTGSSELIVNYFNAPSYATTLTLQEENSAIQNSAPNKYELSQNYPNPFNPTTNISFTIAKDARVKIAIYDILGHLVQTITNEDLVAGTYKITFDGHNLSSGTYFYELTAGDFRDVKKMILIK